VCCSVLQCVAVCCSVLQCVAVCCSVLQCVAVCCSVSTTPFIHIYSFTIWVLPTILFVHHSPLYLFTTLLFTRFIYVCIMIHHMNTATLCVAVCCSVLHCVAVCCSVLQSVSQCCSMYMCIMTHHMSATLTHDSMYSAFYVFIPLFIHQIMTCVCWLTIWVLPWPTTLSRLLQIIGLFCKRALQKRRYSTKETWYLLTILLTHYSIYSPF